MLTIAAVKAAQPAERPYKLFDGGGLFLYVAPSGLKSWRLKYRQQKREQLLVLGRWPETSLAEARLAREQAKEAVRAGAAPRQGSSARGGSFETLARAWHGHSAPGWSTAHAADVLASLERDVFPAIGDLAPAAIKPLRLLELLRSVEQRGCIATARRLRHRLSAVFRFGIAEGLTEDDPAEKLAAAMRPLPLARPMAALTQIEDCRALLAAVDALPGAGLAARAASRFLALTAVRLNAVRGARWGELRDLTGPDPLWTVPPGRMKLGQAKKNDERFAHAVPLGPAAIAVLAELAQVGGFELGNAPPERLVFTGRGGGSPVGEGALRDLYAEAGFAGRHVPHGWRASFSTIMNEALGPEWRDDIDRALAHQPKDKIEAAYNRSVQLQRRRQVLTRWGELLAG